MDDIDSKRKTLQLVTQGCSAREKTNSHVIVCWSFSVVFVLCSRNVDLLTVPYQCEALPSDYIFVLGRHTKLLYKHNV